MIVANVILQPAKAKWFFRHLLHLSRQSVDYSNPFDAPNSAVYLRIHEVFLIEILTINFPYLLSIMSKYSLFCYFKKAFLIINAFFREQLIFFAYQSNPID